MTDPVYVPRAYAGYGIELKPVTPWDLPSLRRWRNSLEIREHMLNQTHIGAGPQRRWFESISIRDDQAHWVVWCKGQRTGHVNVRSDGSLTEGKVVHGGYYISDTPVRHGLLGVATSLMYHDIIFDHIHASQICDTVRTNNSTARKLNEQLGYVEHGGAEGVIAITLDPADYGIAHKKFLRYFNDITCQPIS